MDNVQPPSRLQTLAARQWHDYRQCTPGTYFAEPQASLTLEEAYNVQIEVARLRCTAGDTIAGYKVGCVGPGIAEQFGMSGPIHARLFRSEIWNSGATLQQRSYSNLAIEGEMAVRIDADGRIAAAFPVIELHHFVFRAARKTLAELVANNGINAGVIVPDHLTTVALDDWANAHTLSVTVNGATIDAGPLWAMTSGATEAIEWLRGDLNRFGMALKPGDIVLTGTPLGLHPVKAGDHVVVSINGKDCVDCHVS